MCAFVTQEVQTHNHYLKTDFTVFHFDIIQSPNFKE